MQVLRRLIVAPYTMASNNSSSVPIMLGEEAEILLQGVSGEADDIWRILQIRVHSDSPEIFTHHMGLMSTLR